MQQNNFPSVNEDNRGVFEILTSTMVAAKREGVDANLLTHLHKIGEMHNIDPWDIDQAAKMELQVKKAS
jgi:hypothetical protein